MNHVIHFYKILSSHKGNQKVNNMKINMGSADRIVRFIVAAVIAVLYISGIISGMLGIILLVLGGIFVLTSVVGFCPLYAPFGIRTCKTKENK